jgi:hypothetical protein
MLDISDSEVQQKLDSIQNSPYHGFANMPVRGVPADWMLPFTCNKDFIPWQYVSLMFDLSSGPPCVLDYNGTLGKLGLFLDDLRNTLQVAKQLGSPGIVLDLEFYANQLYSGVGDAADLVKISKEEMQTAFSILGNQFAIIINEEFPTAIIWGPLCVIGSTGPIPATEWSAYWITQGILENLLPTVTLIAGAEAEIPYTHSNFATFETDADLFLTQVVPSNVKLGCPLMLWNNKNETGLFITDYLLAHPECVFNTLEDFRPVVTKAKRDFSYVWIYNYPTATGWSPFDSSGDAVAELLA